VNALKLILLELKIKESFANLKSYLKNFTGVDPVNESLRAAAEQ